MLTKLTLPITKVDDTDPGTVEAVTGTEDSVALNPGTYKIAAMGQPLLWKKGSDPVTAAIGSYLGAEDQEVIVIEGTPGTDTETLRWILADNASGDGEINIVKVRFFDVKTIAPDLSIVQGF